MKRARSTIGTLDPGSADSDDGTNRIIGGRDPPHAAVVPLHRSWTLPALRCVRASEARAATVEELADDICPLALELGAFGCQRPGTDTGRSEARKSNESEDEASRAWRS
jgi:hypothetical protein